MTTPAPDRDTMDGGLRAAFGKPEPTPLRASVLHVLRQQTGSRLDLHLHSGDGDDGDDAPVRVDDATKAMRDVTGRYQVLGEIGRGGVGIVYKGRDQDLGRDVAMKVLRSEYAGRPEIVERFVEEAQIGGQLQHPGIVPVYEIGLQAGERPYFAMKLVKGETLAALLGRRQQLFDDRRRLLAVFEQVCQTIAYAHARRVVHRDLKPANVMVGAFGEVQVVDWGFAKVLPRAGEAPAKPAGARGSTIIETVRSAPRSGPASASELGSTMGTPAYMPPEQALGHVDQVDERSDVFGLGAILCEILTGSPPYLERDGDVLRQAARCDLAAAHTRLDQCGADPALITLCRRCLAGPRSERPASGREVAEAIAAHSTSVEERAQQALIHAAEARGRARSTAWLAAAAVALVTLGGGGFVLLQQKAQERRDAANARVTAAIAEAEQRLGAARSGDGRDAATWTRALDAATRAQASAGEVDVAAPLRTRAEALLATVRDGQTSAIAAATQAAKDRIMQQRLLETRTALDQFAIREMAIHSGPPVRQAIAARFAADYGRVFAWYLDGRELTTLAPEDAIAALRGPLAVELAVALDDWRTWPLRLGGERGGHDAAGDRLLALAMALDPDAWRNRLRTLLTMPKVERADVEALRREADLATLPPVSLSMLAHAFDLVDALDEAMAVLTFASDRHPTDFGCVFDLGQIWYRRDPPRALTYYLAARALRPESAIVHHNLGALRRMLGDLDGALVSHQRAVELDPDAPVVHDSLGLVLVDLGRHAEAEACYRRALALDPRFARAHNNLGFCLDLMGRHQDAIAAIRQALALYEPFPDAWRNLGDALLATDALDEAVAAYRRSLALDPKEPITHNALGLALGRLGRADEAEQALRAAIAAAPGFAPAHFNLGVALQARGRLADALASLQRAEAIWARAEDAYGRAWYPRVIERIEQVEAALGGR